MLIYPNLLCTKKSFKILKIVTRNATWMGSMIGDVMVQFVTEGNLIRSRVIKIDGS